MSAKKRAKGTLTIDMARGVYVQQDARGVRESAYRSERSAAAVADYLKWRGYTVRVIGQAKKKGEDRKMNKKQLQNMANSLRKVQVSGSTSISGDQRKQLQECGYLEPRNKITELGRELLEQYPPTNGSIITRKAGSRLQSTANALRMVEADGIDGVSPARERSLRDEGYLDGRGLTDKAYALMEEYPDTRGGMIGKAKNHTPEAELSEVKATHNGNGHTPIVVEEWTGRVVSSTPVKQEDKARVMLRSVRGRLLGIVRESLPDGLRGLVDEVEQINEILDE